MIAHELIENDIREAWKARRICTTFRNCITTDITLTQTPNALAKSRRIIKNLLPQYLFQRVVTLRGPHDAVLVSSPSVRSCLP